MKTSWFLNMLNIFVIVYEESSFALFSNIYLLFSGDFAYKDVFRLSYE